MIGPVLGLLAANALFLAAGCGLLRALGGWTTWRGLVARLGLSFMAGVGAVGVVLQLALVAGIPFGVPLVVGVCAALAATGLLGRGGDGPSFRRPPRFYLLPAALVLGMLALLAVDLLYQPLGTWDAWAQWTAKAKAIVLFDGLDAGLLGSAPYHPWNPDYPTLVPSIEAADFAFMGRFDTRVIHVQFWLLLAGFVLALAELLRDRVRPALVWPVLLLVVVAPSVQEQTASAIADMPLALFFALAGVCGWLWLTEGRTLWLGLLAIFAAAAVATKFEGRLFVAALFAAFALVLAFTERRRLLGLGAAAAVAVLGTLPWILWASDHHLQGAFSTSLESAVDRGPFERLDRVPVATGSLGAHLFDPTAWLVIVPLAVVAIVLAALAARDRRGVVVVCVTAGLSLGGLVGAYWLSPLDIDAHLDRSVSRVVSSTVVFLAATTPLLLAAALEGAASRTVDETDRRTAERSADYALTP